VYVRLDRGLWDSAYSVENANLVLTIVAVQQSHPLRAFLDSQQALCPIKQSRSGPTCDCELENFPVRPARTLLHLSPRTTTVVVVRRRAAWARVSQFAPACRLSPKAVDGADGRGWLSSGDAGGRAAVLRAPRRRRQGQGGQLAAATGERAGAEHQPKRQMNGRSAPSPLAFVQCILALGSHGRTFSHALVSRSTRTPRAVVG
jgi:hypothetical protein